MFTFISLIFIIFAASRTFLRYQDDSLSIGGTVLWSLIWLAAAIFVLWPGLSADLAIRLGIGRGTDVVVYSAILVTLYLVFRLYIKISVVDQEITRLVRALAFKRED